jgi:hypothetical protein
MGTDMMVRRSVIALVLLILSSVGMQAQKLGLSVNLLECAKLGTLNVAADYAVGRHWSLTADARYNPFTFHKGDLERQFQARQQSYSIGARLWPWHIMSGWWFAGKARWQEYNVGGIFSARTREGDRFGAGLYAGYAHMLSSHFNIEFGLGVWAGADRYNVYSCQQCGLTVDGGTRAFVLPDDVMISLVYVF